MGPVSGHFLERTALRDLFHQRMALHLVMERLIGFVAGINASGSIPNSSHDADNCIRILVSSSVQEIAV